MKDGTVMTLRENGQLEAKRAKGGVPESIWETYSAFANTNGGLIILGAEEGPKGEVEYVGVPNPEQLVKKFWDGVHNPSKVSANIRSPLRQLTTATLSAFKFLAPTVI